MVKKIATVLIICLMLTQWVNVSHAAFEFNHNHKYAVAMNDSFDGSLSSTHDTPVDVHQNCKECSSHCHSQCHSHLFMQNSMFIDTVLTIKNLPFYGKSSFQGFTHTPDSPPPNSL